MVGEYNDNFKETRADIGRSKLAKHRIEMELEVEPHNEGTRRSPPGKAAEANQVVEILLA